MCKGNRIPPVMGRPVPSQLPSGEKNKAANLSKTPSFPFLLLSVMLYGMDYVFG